MKTAMSVVPPPMSTTATPMRRSSGRSTDFVAGQRFQHQFVDIDAMAHHTLDQVADCGATAGDDVGIDLQAHAGHADGILDIAMVIHRPTAGDGVDDLLILGQGDGPGRVQGLLHVGMGHARGPVDGADAWLLKVWMWLPAMPT